MNQLLGDTNYVGYQQIEFEKRMFNFKCNLPSGRDTQHSKYISTA